MSESPELAVPAAWNDTAAPLPTQCAYRRIEEQARLTPDWIAVVRGSERLTYDALNRRANRLAHWLLERGVGPGQIVALYGARTPDQLVAWLAVQKAGGCYLPIDPDYPAGRVRQMLADADARVLLTDRARAERLGELPEHSLQLDADAAEYAQHSDHDPQHVVTLDDPLYLIYTSGSTGTPKGSLVSQRGAANLYEHYVRALRLTSANRFLIVSSMAFDLTQKNLFCPLMVGGTVVLPDSDSFDAELILDTVAREGVSNLNCTPSAFHAIIDGADAATWARLATLRQLALGGEPVNLQRLAEWRARCGAELINGYGPTECSAVVAMHILPGDVPAPSDLPIGKPVANTQLHVLDAQLQPLEIGEEGELCVSGVQVGLGYLNRQELSAERFLDHPQYGRLYRTGDRAQWNEDGTLHYLGRIDQQVKLRGFRIELGEIEAALAAQEGVKEAVVLVRQDGDSEPRLVAYLVPSTAIALDPARLRAALAERLPDYMLPAAWLVLERLPLTVSGKIDRRALPAPTTERPPLSVAYAAPTEPLEEALATLWAELLEVSPVGIDDPFFELGGSSLKAIQSVGRLGKRLGVKPLVVDLFAAGSIRRYARSLRARHAEAVTAAFGAPAATPVSASKAATAPRHAAPVSGDEVVIVGMAARLPGAESVEQFWDNLRNGVESIVPVSEDELDAAGVAPDTRSDPGYVRRHATLADADCFDHQFFGVSPREAALMDPQQRLLLECAWASLEHAGYDPAHVPGRVGAYCGVARNSYFSHNLAGDPVTRAQLSEVHITFGNDKDYAATHISHKLNLRGPAITAQTACSTGGVLLHLARRALLAGECDAAIVGGARVVSPLKAGYPWIDGSIFSKDGRMRVFDAEGSGMIRGSGVACLVLKRRADAERDGDTVYAVIRGSALNNDGSDKVSYTAPSVGGQAEVIGMALDDAGVSADTLSYVEAHGTATHLGDPIEVTALTQAWRLHSSRSGYAKIGSVKSNIGHLDPAAALASTIKTALALKHRYIPASLGYETPNPQIDFAGSPFTVAARGAEWDGPSPRRAGVSSFGIGGTNAHLILEEAPAPTPLPAAARRWQLLPLAAKTDAALEGLGAKLAAHFGGHAPAPLADAAWTLQTGRTRFDKRAVAVAADASGASRALQAVESWARGTPLLAPSVVFVFPGQGAQHPGMGRELYESEPLYRALIDEGCGILQPLLGVDLRAVLYPAPAQATQAAETLRQTGLAQPAIFLTSYALAKLWESLGIQPALMLGHSVGEFVAATLAGVFTFADALKLLAARARLMQAMPGGSMLAIRLPEDKARALLPAEVDVAALNAPASTIVSGPTPAIDALEATLKARDIGTARLHTSHGFHSAMMDPVLAPFAAEVAAVPRGAPQRTIISTATGAPLSAEQARDPNYWARQLRGTVRFADAVAEALKQPGRVLLEVGPGQSLSGPLRQLVSAYGAGKATVVPSAPAAAQEDASAGEHLMLALGRLWIAGVEPDWTVLHGGARRHVGLPTYAFARVRHWIEPSLAMPAPLQAATLAPAAETAQDSAAPPADALRGRAVKVLSEITGMDFAPGDDGKSFLELGMDSLMLTQVAGRLKAEFRLDLKFRQLMEELSTLDKLCAHLKVHASGAPVAPSPDGNQAPELDVPEDDGKPKKAFGAAVRITKSAGETLTPRQQKSLDALIARYNAKTPKSKASAQQHRAYFADPRTVSGFRPMWKETVYPIVSTRSDGAHLWDVDGNQYIDTVNGFGATLFGHKPEFVDAALRAQIDKGYEVGPVQDYIGDAARLFTKLTRLERVAFCSTGSEAVSAAVRCARTVTGRDLVVSFNGDYHGIQDEVIVRPGPKGRGVPAAGGIPFTNTAATLILDYGDPKSLEIIAARADEIAAVMVEPVQSRNMDLQPKEFLQECRRLADAAGYAFIMDEVITGFRAAPGGAQEYFGVPADLASYGKVFGGGMPVGAVAGKAKFMDALDGGGWQFGDGSVPEAGVTYFAGTFVRHPMTMAAVYAVLKYLDANRELQPTLIRRTTGFVARLNELCRETGAPLRFPHFSSTFRLEWTQDEPFYELFAVYLRERGLHTYDGRVQVMTTAHTDEVLEQLYGIFRSAILDMQRDGLLGRAGEPVKIGFDAEAAGGIFFKPPLPGAKLGRDAQGNPAWFVADPKQPWKYLQVGARS